MRSITTFDLQYAHRFYGFQGEAQYLHGHTGVLTIEVEDRINEGVNMVYPCNEIQKVAWSLLKNFDHALILQSRLLQDTLPSTIYDEVQLIRLTDGTRRTIDLYRDSAEIILLPERYAHRNDLKVRRFRNRRETRQDRSQE